MRSKEKNSQSAISAFGLACIPEKIGCISNLVRLSAATCTSAALELTPHTISHSVTRDGTGCSAAVREVSTVTCASFGEKLGIISLRAFAEYVLIFATTEWVDAPHARRGYSFWAPCN